MGKMRNRGLKRRLFAALAEQSPLSAETLAELLDVGLQDVLQCTYPSSMLVHRRCNPNSPWVQQLPRIDGGYDLQLVHPDSSLTLACEIINGISKGTITHAPGPVPPVEVEAKEESPDITAIKTVDDLINYVELLEREVTILKRENFDMKRTLDRLQSRITSVVIKPVIAPTDDDECDD